MKRPVKKPAGRRGAAMLIVMALLAVTMVASYAVLRASATVARIQANGNRDNLARQAAATGMAAALRKMHVSAEWAGVGTTLAGTLSATLSYSVTYTTGDSTLTSTSPDYYQYPYRVTLLSTGTATDATNPTLTTTHQIRVVVQLVRQAVASQPTNWSMISSYTLLQTGDTAYIEFPNRVQGTAGAPIRLYGDLSMFTTDPSGNSRATFANDLRLMNGAGQGDYRPFSGPVQIYSSGQSGDDVSITSSSLGQTVSTFSGSTVSIVPTPPNAGTYRLYAGGAIYNTTLLNTNVSNLTLTPDPLTNPLGICRRGANVNLGANVSITGAIWSTAKVTINGANVSLQAFELPALYGQATPMQLPILHVDDFMQSGTATATVNGLVAVADDFEFDKGNTATTLTLTGKVVCADLFLETRTEWDLSSSMWDLYLFLFNSQKSGGEQYYPNWLRGVLNSALTPRCTIQPPSSTVTYLGQTLSTTSPLYVPSNGIGLVWDLIDWKDLD